MTEDFLNRMNQLLDHHPESDTVTQFIISCKNDPALVQEWYDFLVEQYLAGNTTEAWKKYIIGIPQIEEQIVFQQQLQQGIRVIGERNTKEEIRKALPKQDINGINKTRRSSSFFLFAVSMAAVALICLAVLANRLWGEREDGALQYTGVPVVMIEEFEAEGVTEEMLVHGIPQRIPAKLSATNGIYPVTSFAVNHATHRTTFGETPQMLLNAMYSMRGKVRRQGDNFLIEASLIDVAKNRELWKELFPVEDNPKAFDDLHDQLSLRVVNVLNVAINDNTRARLTMEVSNNIEALNLFLEGERQWLERTDSSLQEAITLFQLALERDSSSTIIHGYLALAYATYAENDYGDSSDWQKAVMHANKTLLVDPHNAEALVVLGSYASTVEKDYWAAAGYFDNALQSQPGDAKVHQAIAELYIRTGDIAEGTEHIRIARAIEPEHRVVRWIETKYLTASGRLEDARHAAMDLADIHPSYLPIKNFMWQYHLSKGEYDISLDSIPAEASQYSKDYMSAIVHVHNRDFHSLASIDQHDFASTFQLLGFVQNNEWKEARLLVREMLEEHRFDLLPLFQTSDFALFNKIKEDSMMRMIFAEYGIKVHLIPEYVEPEI
jgi:tetratricopeptide (TPR) repeat protein